MFLLSFACLLTKMVTVSTFTILEIKKCDMLYVTNFTENRVVSQFTYYFVRKTILAAILDFHSAGNIKGTLFRCLVTLWTSPSQFFGYSYRKH